MRLSVNIDHFATLREARRAAEPEPALIALLAELAGAGGITTHLRGDRRHIKERDLRIIREVIKTKLTLEMAATADLKRIALEIGPDAVCLVPEKAAELTTTGGLDIAANRRTLAPFIKELVKGRIRPSNFRRSGLQTDRSLRRARRPQIEIHTGSMPT